MNLFPKASLEYQIITHLQKKSWVIVELIEELRRIRPKLSKQAVYQILRSLKRGEIVIVLSKRVSLSSIWIDRMHEFFSIAKYAYEGGASVPENTPNESFLNLEDGDSISYLFKNPNATDVFWAHALNILMGIMPKDEPVYLYNPHQWFLLARTESETLLLDQALRENHRWFQYISHKTPLDDFTKSFFKRPHLVHTQEKQYFKENYYVNLFDDFIIEVVLDPKTQSAVDEFYNTHIIWNTAAKNRIIYIVSHMKGRNKLTISRNAKKSENMKRMLGKYFV
jgi:hypothetical protein